VPRNTDGSTTVGYTRTEITDVTSLVTTSEPQLVVLSVDCNVLVVPLCKLFDGRIDVLHSSGLTHGQGAVVGVATSAVPVTLERFRVEGDLDSPLLGNADQKVTSHPEVVTHGNTLARTDLELPLRRHDLSVDTADVDTRVQASTVVSLNEITCDDLSSA
jgi:hypothetical protein